MSDQRPLLSANRIDNKLVVNIHGDVVGENLEMLQTSLLDRLKEGDVHVVIFDVSTVEVMDLTEFESFAAVVRMTELLGVSSVVIGVNPGVAAFLADSDADLGGLRTALDIDDVDRAITFVRKR